MSDRELLLRKISTAQFAAWELHIYLDTHPRDAAALKKFRQYEKKTAELTAEYQSKYGPLRPSDPFGDTSWEWVNSPWPWENTEVAK